VLDHLYVDNTRELQSDFGPAVHDGPLRRRTANRNPLIARDGTSRRPEATLIAHLASHSDAIVGFTVAPDHTFFVSGSTDGTVRVWDSARLERNVTAKPRHTYNQHHAPITALTTIEGTHCFASASRDGSLHVVRVHVALGAALPKYGKLQVVREHRVGHAGEYITSMVHYNTGKQVPITHLLVCLTPSHVRHYINPDLLDN
jgi:phosphoinositide-3-kinase regulatory subunit 4